MKWIYLKVDENTVKKLQDKLFDEQFKQVGYELENEPHVTLIPKYKTETKVDFPDISNQINVSGFRFYPSKEKPMVVMLDVSEDENIYSWRHHLVNSIGRENIQYNLHPPHITLFKAGDSGDENKFSVNEEIKSQILQNINNTEPPRTIHVKEIVKADWNDF